MNTRPCDAFAGNGSKLCDRANTNDEAGTYATGKVDSRMIRTDNRQTQGRV
jgi:hypothetical protein